MAILIRISREDMIDASPKTTVAALNGPALGGGAEVSLACSVLKGWKLLRERVRDVGNVFLIFKMFKKTWE